MIRPWRPTDRPFVADTWLASFKQSHWKGLIRDSSYREVYGSIVDEILDSPGVRVVVDCNPDDEDQIFGWACVRDSKPLPTLHYLYVKHPYRDTKQGKEQPRIALKLLKHLAMDSGQAFRFTFRTPQWDALRTRWRLNAKYAPELVTKDRHEEKAA